MIINLINRIFFDQLLLHFCQAITTCPNFFHHQACIQFQSHHEDPISTLRNGALLFSMQKKAHTWKDDVGL